MDPSAPGWYPDPTGRHERRYWSGIRWSRHVDDGGRRADDPIEPDSSEHRAIPARVPIDQGLPGPPTRAQVPVPAQAPPQPPLAPPAHRPSFDQFHAVSRPPRGGRVLLVVGVLAAVALVAAAALVLNTGGGDDDAAGTDQSDDPLMSYLIEYTRRASGGTIDDGQASCMAGNVVDVLTRERLLEADVLQQENPLDALTGDEIVSFIAAAFDCLDDEELVTYMAASWDPQPFGGIPNEGASCILRGLLDGWDRPRMIEVFGELANPQVEPEITEIVHEDELGTLGTVISDCQRRFPPATTTVPPS